MILASSYFLYYILRIYLASKEIVLFAYWCWTVFGDVGKLLEILVVLF